MLCLKLNYITSSDVVQFGHLCFQIFVLFSASAVASVVGCTIFIEDGSRFVQGCCVFAFCSEAEEVEATDEDIWFQPFHDVEDAFVRATADNDAFTVFFNNEILFVEEIIRDEFAINKFVQTVRISKVFCFTVVAV